MSHTYGEIFFELEWLESPDSSFWDYAEGSPIDRLLRPIFDLIAEVEKDIANGTITWQDTIENIPPEIIADIRVLTGNYDFGDTTSYEPVVTVIEDEVSDINDLIYTVVIDVVEPIENNQTDLNNQTNIDTALILRQILDAVNNNNNARIDNVDLVLSDIINSNASLTDSIQSFNFSIGDGIDSVLAGLGSVLATTSRDIEVIINNRVVLDRGIFDAITGQINDIVRTVIEGNITLFEGFKSTTDIIIEDLLGDKAGLDKEQIDQIKRIADVLVNNETVTNTGFEALVNPGLEGFGSNFARGISEGFEEIIKNGDIKIDSTLMDIIRGDNDRFDILRDCGVEVPVMGDIESGAQWIINVIGSVVAYILLPLNMAQVKSNIEMQKYRQCYPDALMLPEHYVRAWHYGHMEAGDAVEQIRKQGFTTEDAGRFLEDGFLPPSLDLLFSEWFRGFISDDDLELQMRRLQFSPQQITQLKKVAFFIPPVQDLITMAVREVFSPEIARANGQFDDFPPEFGKWAEQQGVSEEWALNYWAAHWRLPSEQMGFEMLHRGVIDEDRLRGLLVALDIMPGWRDEIIQISYTPFSRVDIRRMHKMGVLDDAAVELAYRDIGYSPEKSKMQLEFVKALNDEEDLVTLNIASDLTRSNIIGFYTEGIINRVVALALLLQAGINVAAAELFLMDADLTIERKERKDNIALVLARFKNGIITYELALNEISGLNLEERERNKVSIELLKIREDLHKLPSRADLDKFLKADLVSDEEYIQTMVLNGYTLYWAQKYLELNTGQEA